MWGLRECEGGGTSTGTTMGCVGECSSSGASLLDTTTPSTSDAPTRQSTTHLCRCVCVCEFVCVRARARACVGASVCVCVCVCVRERACDVETAACRRRAPMRHSAHDHVRTTRRTGAAARAPLARGDVERRGRADDLRAVLEADDDGPPVVAIRRLAGPLRAEPHDAAGLPTIQKGEQL
jgi:hypothetical protein